MPVLVEVVLRGVSGVLAGMRLMGAGQVRMVGRLMMVARVVMLRRFGMVMGGHAVMMRGLTVFVCCLL